MAHHQSAIKRIRQSAKLKIYNRQKKTVVKNAIKDVQACEKYDEAVIKLNFASKVLDKVTARGIMHKNTAARRKSMLARFVNSLKEQN
ncbi:MAG: 30S ribosomal protein S20 [Candidatus Kapabacteria bacterium]|jgi:small subunit ribosomal protein S20|nr:30S ribosomal protein S20 [Candidatus Kapabacteria bacterium]